MDRKTIQRTVCVAVVVAGLAIGSVLIMAQAKPAAEQATDLVATSVNVNGAGETIDFHIFKWSTDADRDKLAAAWNPAPPAVDDAGARGVGGRGGARGAGGRGGDAAPAPPKSPETALTDTLKQMPDVGYFWTSEVAGYLIRYAQRLPLSGGGSRIILLTDHRLGFSKKNWQPTGSATPNSYEFTLIELRLPANGEGEGKASLSGKIAIDPSTKVPGLVDYDTLPVVMKGVKLRSKT
jgi:hypothetical protein